LRRLASALAALLLATLTLTGCALLLGPCSFCAQDTDDTFPAPAEAGALMAMGVTVIGGPPGQDLDGSLEWIDEELDAATPRDRIMSLPDDLRSGERRLMVWRVPVGVLSLRQATVEDDKSPVISPRAVATSFAPGDMVYAGEILIDISHRPATLAFSQATEKTRADLAAYPGLTAPLQLRPLQDLRQSDHDHSGSDQGQKHDKAKAPKARTASPAP
jgi:hypothetical protein